MPSPIHTSLPLLVRPRRLPVIAGGLLAATLLLGGCAARGGGRFVPPTGPGAPAPEFAQRFEEATRACRDIHTMTAEAALSGRVGGRRVRGRLQMGLGDPNAMRLEAVAPFGQPIFILAAHDGEGTLLLPRDNEVLPQAPAAAIVEALAGIALSPTELRAVATGCVSPSATATGGQQYGDALTAITLSDQSIVYIRSIDGAPRIVFAHRPGLEVEYGRYERALPRVVHLRRVAAPAAGAASSQTVPEAVLSLELSQIELDVALGPEAFTVEVPKGARPVTLEQLRQSGPLGQPPPSRKP